MIKKSGIIKALIWLHIILMVLAYQLYRYLSVDTYFVFYTITSFAWFILAVGLLKLVYNTSIRCAGIALLGLTLNNFLDEVFFDPLRPGWNEYILAFFILLWIARDTYTAKKSAYELESGTGG